MMNRLVHTRFYRHILVASCMLASGIPVPVLPLSEQSSNSDSNHGPGSKSTVISGPSRSKRGIRSAKKSCRSVIDSGATIHCIKDKSLFTHLDTTTNIRVRVANNQVIVTEGVGTCSVIVKDVEGKSHTLVLHNCVYSPKFSDNLISTRRLWKDNRISTHMGGSNYLKCHYTRAKYYFEQDCSHQLIPAARSVDTEVDMHTLHSRFNHCGPHRLHKLFSNSNGLGPAPQHSHVHSHNTRTCPACLEGASRKRAFAKRREHEFSYFGERISSDLCGPFPKSVDGYLYALCFVDAYTNFCAIYLLKSKASSEVKDSFKSFVKEYDKYMRHGKPITWHTDNAKEFLSKDLDAFCEEFAVHRSFSVPYAPPQNAQAERIWGILLKPVRALLAQSRVDDAFWSFAIRHVCQCHNVLPSYAQPDMRTPYEALTGEKPDVSRFKVWGCLAWYLAPDHEHESKLSPRAWPAIHLGFDPYRNGYLVYIPHKNRITTGYHITFQEHRFLQITSTHVSGLPRIPKPVHTPQILYKEPRDSHNVPALPPPLPPPPHTPMRTHDRGSNNNVHLILCLKK